MTAGGKIKKDGTFLLMATRAQTPSAGYADLPGVRLWYTNSGGSGVPVVLLHANTGNADSWEYNIPGFVEAGYWVIVTFDRRGWGRSKYIGQDLTPNQGATEPSAAPERRVRETENFLCCLFTRDAARRCPNCCGRASYRNI
jgi:pimeloyl-ACP methyl ester carboxylesterase